MNRYDYITATIEDEKIRLEKLISYLKETDSILVNDYLVRYNNICFYLDCKNRYLNVLASIKEKEAKLEELLLTREEEELDNMLLEDTLLDKFNEDTSDKYVNLKYSNIRFEDKSMKEILYLILDKESNYNSIVKKRCKLKNILSKDKYPKTIETINSQDILINKQESTNDSIFLTKNSIKIDKDKLKDIELEVMVPSVLKILYEFWIIDSYDRNKIDRSKLFNDNRSLVDIKDNIKEDNVIDNSKDIEDNKKNNIDIVSDLSNLKLPGINEDIVVDLDNKEYLNDIK